MVLFGISHKKAKLIAKEANKDVFNKFGNLCASCWTDQAIEISAIECTKSNGISLIAKEYGIDKKDIIVMGDSGNDIPMFKDFYENSYCVSRSPETIKKYAIFHA